MQQQQQQQQQQTETGINISTYSADKAANRVKLLKPIPGSATYLYVKATFQVGEVAGIPALVEGQPEIKNINRQSLIDLEAQLGAQEAAIAEVRAQVAAITADMDALDLVA